MCHVAVSSVELLQPLTCTLPLSYSAEEIEEKVNSFRMMLQEQLEPAPTPTERPKYAHIRHTLECCFGLRSVHLKLSCLVCNNVFCPCYSCMSSVTETHALAAANQQKNDRLKQAFGISSDYVDGSSFHPDRKEREKEKREQERLERERLQQQKYQ